jgi:glutathione synthase/RimK-type ligase-like ATP-grasp enzyme
VIILCGIPSEGPLHAVIAAAERRGVDHVVFNQRDASHAEVQLDARGPSVRGTLNFQGRAIDTAQVRGVFLRVMDLDDLPEYSPRRRQNDPAPVDRARAIQHALLEWLDVADCRVLNRPGNTLSNMSKAFQALTIRRAGFRIPATLITNDPDAVRAFAKTHGRVIFKSASSVRSIVRELTSEHRRELERVRDLPTQFQEYIPGVNVRVHTVGPRHFATEVRSDVVDYRYATGQGASVDIRAGTLPPKVAERCIALAEGLGLPFAGIDLKRTPAGQYYCLEVNPAPAYTYYEEATGQPIADAVVEYLAAREP